MALRVWLPLNGSLENKGISDIEPTIMGSVPMTTDGKIGKCAYFANSPANCIHMPGLKQISNFSWACWFKCAGSGATSYQFLLSEGRDCVQYGTNLRLTQAGTGLYAETGADSAVVRTATKTIELNKWYHAAMTIDDTELKLYVDGELFNTKTLTLTPNYEQSNDKFVIGKMAYGYSATGSYFPFNGYVNDVRIYDHCLSPKEIKEISQGLILHYKLNGWSGGSGENLLRGSASIGNTNALIPGWVSNGSASNIEIIDNNIIHYKHNLNNTKYIPSIVSNVVAPLQWGKTYTYSMDLKLDKDITLSTSVPMHYWLGARNADDIWQTAINTHNITGSTTTVWVQNHNGVLSANTWVTIITKFTLPTNAVESGYNYPGLRPFVYGSVLTSEYTGEVNVWIKNCKIELGSVATSWSPAPEDLNIDTTKITDSSGYGNDGIITGEITTGNGGGRYNISTYIPLGSTDYITTNNTIGNPQDAITMSIWFKSNCTTPGNSYHEIFNHATSSQYFEFAIHNSGYFRGGMVINGTRYVANTSALGLLDGNWHMISMTYDGSTIIRYVDGISRSTTAISGTLTGANGKFLLGHYGPNTTYYAKEAYIADARIYATALSAEDILDLYHTPANIDNLGGLHGFEFIDNINNRIMEANGTIATKNWNNSTLLKNYTQTNCQVTLTDDGLRIYRPPNYNPTNNGNTMWGGMRINNTRNGSHPIYAEGDNILGLEKNHTYILAFHVKGKSSNATNNYGWTNQMGWGGGGLSPTPTDISYDLLPSNFNGEKECWYKWTINDDIVKTCTTSYSYAVAGNQYMSYADFAFGWQYQDTGALGSDVYITNLRLYDITNLDMSNIQKNGVINFTQLDELTQVDKASITFYKELQASNFIEK